MSICDTGIRLCSAVVGAAMFSQSSISRLCHQRTTPPQAENRILIVEFRDEVYAALQADLERQGFIVERAIEGCAAARAVAKFKPHLVLMFAEMPDQCAWLVTKKLRFARCKLPVWVYTSLRLHFLDSWKELSGADQAWGYRGDLLLLLEQLRSRLSGKYPQPASAPLDAA